MSWEILGCVFLKLYKPGGLVWHAQNPEGVEGVRESWGREGEGKKQEREFTLPIPFLHSFFFIHRK